MKRLFTVLCVLLFSFSLFSQAKIVKLVTLDWPPYIGSEIKDGSSMSPNFGYVADLVTQAYKKMGYEVIIDFRPWERALNESTSGIYDGLMPEYYSKERESDFVFSAAFPGGPVGFLQRKESKISFKTLKDLSKYTIGIVAGYINTTEFDNASYLKKEEAVDDETNIRKLIGKRIDLIFIDKYVAQFLIKSTFSESSALLEFIEPGLEVKPLYIAFSKKAKGYEQKMKDFNTGLAKLKDEGKIVAIMKAHGLEVPK